MYKLPHHHRAVWLSAVALFLVAMPMLPLRAQVLKLLEDAAKIAEKGAITDASSLRTLSIDGAQALRNIAPAERAQLALSAALASEPQAPYLQLADDKSIQLYVHVEGHAISHFSGETMDEALAEAKMPRQKTIIVDYLTATTFGSEVQSLTSGAQLYTFTGTSGLSRLIFVSTPHGLQADLLTPKGTSGGSRPESFTITQIGVSEWLIGLLLLLICAWAVWTNRKRKGM